MIPASDINTIFKEAISLYHVTDHVDTVLVNKYSGFEGLLFKKNWIDTVQWHLEDLIRDPAGEPAYLISIKRRIDASNQDRTDIVEAIDEHLFIHFSDVKKIETAKLNSETPAWVIDRMSILQLKLFHFEEKLSQLKSGSDLYSSVFEKLEILKAQEQDLILAFDDLMSDLKAGHKYMKMYKQMKMYNDPNLNPILSSKK